MTGVFSTETFPGNSPKKISTFSELIFLRMAFSRSVIAECASEKSLRDEVLYSMIVRWRTSNGKGVSRSSEHNRTTRRLLATAKPSSYQTLGLSVDISARQISESPMPFSIDSISTSVPGSRSTRYGSSPAASIAGANTSSYRLSYFLPPSKG